jgi:hypothetical protein
MNSRAELLVREPVQTVDGILLVASLDDLMSTKPETILDRPEARDYRDLAAMLRSGVSLMLGLSAVPIEGPTDAKLEPR